jgi:hypothetical protein
MSERKVYTFAVEKPHKDSVRINMSEEMAVVIADALDILNSDDASVDLASRALSMVIRKKVSP